MFDWMSLSTFDINVKKTVELFCCKNNVTLETKISQEGEILECGRQVGYYKGIKLTVLNNGVIKLMFSAHKLYNELHSIRNFKGESMNHDTFDIHKMKYVIDWLQCNFGFAPSKTRINQLEFGFNLSNLSIDTAFVLQHLISFKGKRFNDMQTFSRGNGRVISFSQYKLKVYDKSLQNNLDYSILRIEFKALKMQPIQRLFNKKPSLNQLLSPIIWQNCNSYLVALIDSTIIGDEIQSSPLIPVKPHKYLAWFNPLFWETCKADKRSKNKKEFDSLMNCYGLYQIKNVILTAMRIEYSKMI